MKNLFYFFMIFNFFLVPLKLNASSFKGVSVTSKTETEATSNDNTIRNSDMCCDRENQQGWAQEDSPQESQRRVNQLLYSKSNRSNQAPQSGQR